MGGRLLLKLGITAVTLLEDGCEVEAAMAEAAALARPHHVLLLDIQMRQVNGDAVCRSLRAAGATRVPIIALTGKPAS